MYILEPVKEQAAYNAMRKLRKEIADLPFNSPTTQNHYLDQYAKEK